MTEKYLGTPAYGFYKELCNGGARGLKKAAARWVVGAWEKEAIEQCALEGAGCGLVEEMLRVVSGREANRLLATAAAVGVQSIELLCAEGAALPNLRLFKDSSSLTKLDLRSTGITEAQFISMLPLSNLTTLDLRDTSISQDCLLNHIPLLPKLSHLGLPDRISTPLIPQIKSFFALNITKEIAKNHPKLEVLNIEEGYGSAKCALSDVTDQVDMGGVTKLAVRAEVLSLGLFDGVCPANGVSRLNELDLWFEEIEVAEDQHTALSTLRSVGDSLQTLSFAFTESQKPEVGEEAMALVAALPCLKELTFVSYFAANFLNCDFLTKISTGHLTSLRIDGVVSDAMLTELAPFQNFPRTLKTLCLKSLGKLPSGAYHAICGIELEELDLASLDNTASEILSELSSSSLKYLELNHCKEDAEGATIPWADVVSALPNIVSLLLYGTPPITPYDFVAVLAPQLLSLSSPTNFSEELMSELPENPKQSVIRYFNISEDDTLVSLNKVLEYVKGSLQTIQLESCLALSRCSFEACTKLKEVSLQDTGLDGETAARSFVGCANLETLVLDLTQTGKYPDAIAAVQHLPSLQSLTIYMDDLTLLESLQSSSLKVLNLYHSRSAKLSSDLKTSLLQSCPSLGCLRQV